MESTIYPRSPREIMSGWVHLPRFVDKIRLHLAGKLHPDYQPNFTKGFDGWWLKAAGLAPEPFIAMVKSTITDGEVADWVLRNVKVADSEKAAFQESIFNYPKAGDAEAQARFQLRREQFGLAQRADLKTFVDLIDADEKR